MQLSPIPLTISENQEIVKALQDDEEKFRFIPLISVPFLSFKPSENDTEIESFLQTGVSRLLFMSCQIKDRYLTPHPSNTYWTAQLASLLALECQEIFYPRLRSERIPNDFCFFGLDHGLEIDGKSPDEILTLGQIPKEGNLRIPLLLLEEKLGLDDLQKDTPQFSKYAKKIFAQQISFGEKTLGLEHVYILAVSQTTRQVRLIQYKRPGKDQTLTDCVKITFEFNLFENGTHKLNFNYVHDMLRVLFNCIFLQLKSLDLIK